LNAEDRRWARAAARWGGDGSIDAARRACGDAGDVVAWRVAALRSRGADEAPGTAMSRQRGLRCGCWRRARRIGAFRAATRVVDGARSFGR